MHKALGYIGAISLALCAVPQTWAVIRAGSAEGLDPVFLGSWFIGEACLLVYVAPTKDWPLIFNYGLNMALTGVMLGYKVVDICAIR